ncbi:MAG: acyloxyacyl hydrolase [Alphaproteobacteria bacterium]
MISLTALFGAPAAAAEPDLLSLGIGWYDVNDDVNDDQDAADFRIEYRPEWKFLWELKPWVGFEVTSDGALYGAGGILLDVSLGRRLVLTPSFGVGLYGDGGGKDLGHTIEFRTQIELGYRLDEGARLGVAFGHISNANLSDVNPGTEVVAIYYHMPLGALFGE